MSLNIERLESIKRANSTPEKFAKARFDLASEYKKMVNLRKLKMLIWKLKKMMTNIFSHMLNITWVLFLLGKNLMMML